MQTIHQRAHAIRKRGETLSQALVRLKIIDATPIQKPKKKRKKKDS